jgi:hypothetical protein
MQFTLPGLFSLRMALHGANDEIDEGRKDVGLDQSIVAVGEWHRWIELERRLNSHRAGKQLSTKSRARFTSGRFDFDQATTRLPAVMAAMSS